MFKKTGVKFILFISIIVFTLFGNALIHAENNIDKDTTVGEEYILGPFSTADELEDIIGNDNKPRLFSGQVIPEAKYWHDVEKIIYEKMKKRESDIRVNFTGEISTDKMDKIAQSIDKIFMNDHYIYYNCADWVYGYSEDGNNIQIQLNVDYRTTGAKEEYVDNEVKRILSNIITKGMADREKVKAVHDYIVQNVEYDLSFLGYTAYAALKEGKAVCQGYSLLGYKMLNELGIPTRIISSKDMNHAWNLVKLDGEWYHMDITWDDPIPDVKGRVLYTYYLLDDDKMRTVDPGHLWKPGEYPTSGEGITFDIQIWEWSKVGNKWYYVDSKGNKLTGWKQIDGKWYYMDSGGVMQTGWVKSGGKWYYLTSSGAMQIGWVKVGKYWYYMDNSGAMQTGWKQIDGKWYYMNNDGVMQTGWVKSDGRWYYLNKSGAMQTGWVSVGGKWYYMNSNGAMTTGWQKIGGKWYYMNSSGAMTTGWQKVGGRWYYLDSGGGMQMGWTRVGKVWYYMNSSGAMQTGWIKSNGNWYYLYDNGQMATNTVIEGYKIDKNGIGNPE